MPPIVIPIIYGTIKYSDNFSFGYPCNSKDRFTKSFSFTSNNFWIIHPNSIHKLLKKFTTLYARFDFFYQIV